MIFSFSGAARVCSASWTECTTHLRRGNCRYSFVVRFFWRANGSDFLSRRAHSFCFPRPIRRPFSLAQATGTSCHDLHIWFSAETLCCQSSFSSLGLTFRRCQTSGRQQNCWSYQTQTWQLATWSLQLGPIRASCVMSRFSSHAHHVIFQHGMQLWKTLVKPKRQSTFWLVILIYDQTKWILKGTDNILMSGYGNKCQNACRGKLNKRLIKLAGERIWSVHRVVQEMSVRLKILIRLYQQSLNHKRNIKTVEYEI